jgi:hypothetical protein
MLEPNVEVRGQPERKARWDMQLSFASEKHD